MINVLSLTSSNPRLCAEIRRQFFVGNPGKEIKGNINEFENARIKPSATQH